jgi:hypothetical protein
MRRPSLSRLIDLASQLGEDATRSAAALRRRDRDVGLSVADASDGPDARIGAWLDRLLDAGGPSAGERAARAQRGLAAILVVAGLLLGALPAAALFFYDGSYPVNVVRVLAVFVGLQLALLVATAILALPERWRRHVPGLAALQDALALASPGRWQAGLRRILPPAERAALDRAVGMARSHHRIYGNVQKWTLLLSSQAFAVAFHTGALAAALFLVTFTDLAFGWSTTLKVDAAQLHRITGWIAAPWTSWLQDATPSLALIEATQYFRAGPRSLDPAASAPWWRFVLAAMVTYGLLPRVATTLWARWRLAAAVAHAYHHAPGLAALRDRLDHALVETTADAPELAGAATGASGEGAAAALPASEPCELVLWSGLPLDDAAATSLAERMGMAVARVHRAGEGGLAEDAAVVAGVGEGGWATVLVKAWEPPVLEVLDFLADLRTALGEGKPIAVVPLALDGEGRASAPAPGQARQWRRRLDTAGDPWLVTHTSLEPPGRETP